MSERLTVAIPFYRNTGYLRRAIESVRAQRQPDWRAMVCDDGESDQGALELVRSFDDSRIAYFKNDGNQGIARSWNLCLERADTELVTLLHGDDELRTGYVGVVLDLAKRYPEAVAVCCRAAIIGPDGAPRFSLADAVKRFYVPGREDPLRLRGAPALEAVMAGNFIMSPTLCFRKAALGSRRFDTRWKQVLDLDLTARLLMDGEELIYSRSVEYAYRRHAEATTALQSETRIRFDEEVELFDRVAERAAQLGWEAAARTARRKTIVRLHLLYRAAAELVRLNPRAALDWLRYMNRSLDS